MEDSGKGKDKAIYGIIINTTIGRYGFNWIILIFLSVKQYIQNDISGRETRTTTK
jgi:hypothetical protein